MIETVNAFPDQADELAFVVQFDIYLDLVSARRDYRGHGGAREINGPEAWVEALDESRLLRPPISCKPECHCASSSSGLFDCAAHCAR
ncbi:MAG: hypothetical protein RIC51_07480 [Erythrobacter sp.]